MPGFLDLSAFSSDFVPYRVIDPDSFSLVAQVTVEEDHEDELAITEHPVEQGAAITDHAYKRPAELRVRVGWSQSGGLPTNNAASDVAQIYEQILTLQSSRRPFPVYTGKRAYNNMLVASLRVHTDSKLETTLLADISFKQILLVNTQTISGTGQGSTAAVNTAPVNLASPSSNQPAVQMGSINTIAGSLTTDQIVAAGGT
jgi:hypothetical protein